MLQIPVYILAGGRSSRFGSDKARAMHCGIALLDSVAQQLAPTASSLTVVAREEGAYEDLGLRTIADISPGLGPIGGLLTALEDRDGDGWLLIAACDWTGLRPEWAGRLLEGINPMVRCVLFRDTELQPLFALYHTAIRPQVEQAIDGGNLAMRSLIELVPRKEPPPPPEWEQAKNVNSPDQLGDPAS